MTRPQTLLITLLGRHVYRRPIAVSSATIIGALAGLEVSEGAARSTLSRMVTRGFLERHRVGRESYFSLTPWTERLLEEGEARIFDHPVGHDHSGEWTLLSFSIPEEQRSDRHTLRVALSWRGFGRLRNGLWIAAGAVDVVDMIEERGLSERIDVFVGQPSAPSNIGRIVTECWDLERLRLAYERFIERWRCEEPDGANGALAVQTRLITEWRLLLLDDPRLPSAHLPPSWPAEEAFELFRKRHDASSLAAAEEFEELLRAVDLPSASGEEP